MLFALFAWVLRYGFFAYGDSSFGLPLIVLSCIVYGMAFDFFLISGSMFVEANTDSNIRSSAQGLFIMMTNGFGAYIGTVASSALIDTYFINTDKKFDLVFDAVGKSSFFKCKKLLKENGTYFSTELGYLSQNVYLPLFTKKIIFPIPKDTKEKVEFFKDLAENGYLRAIIDRQYTLEEVAEAHRYVEKGMKVGSVSIKVV
jgi:threonine dehydrogenase-like Zn-dependent dehydrogenase